MIGIALVVGALSSWLLTGLARRYSLSRSLVDVPNHRSSHSVPTPRGGGVAIAVVTLSGAAVLWVMGSLATGTAVALIGGGILVAGGGWLDDHGGLAARWRVAIHASAALWALYWSDGLPSVNLGFAELPLGPAGVVLGSFGIVWAINLFNFMDGIDGIAAGEAISITAVGGMFLLLAGAHGIALVSLLIAAANAGFLIWNWQPAKIFMGDVGSGLLGFFIAVLAIASEGAGVPLLMWVLLGAVFVFDATTTLIRRILRKERWYDAHRSHAYQRAVQAGWTHAQVTTAVLALNLVLAGLAWVAWIRPSWLAGGFVIGMLMVGYCYWRIEKARPM